MAVLGLVLIIIAWYFQLRTPKAFNKTFVGLYASGTLVLVLNSLSYDTLFIAFLNLVIFGMAVWVFTKSPKKSRRR